MIQRFQVVFEILFVFSLVLLVNYLFVPEIPGLVGINPHPFWLVILLFGIRYGVFAGFGAGIVATLLYLGAAWFFLERYLFEELSFYYQPFFFIIIGTLFGEATRRYKNSISNLESDKNQLIINIEILEKELATLKQINHEMERKIVTQMSTLTTLYEGARRLETMELENLYQAILHFVCKTLEIEEASIYLKEGNQWRLIEKQGWQDYHRRPEILKLNEGIIGLAGSKGKIVSIRDFTQGQISKEEMPAMMGDSVFAGPLRVGETGSIVAIFSVQKIPFLKFNSSTMIAFSFLLSWASRAIEKALFFNKLKTEAIHDPEFNVYTYSYFISRANLIFKLAQQYHVPVAVALVSIKGTDGLSEKQNELLMTLTAELLKNSTVDLESVCRYLHPNIQFAMLLVNTTPERMTSIRSKISATFEELQLKFDGKPISVETAFLEIQKGLVSVQESLRQLETQLGYVGKDQSTPSA
jgi:GGDEF domain-containing protein